MIKTMVFERGHDRYVFPSQCEQSFTQMFQVRGIGHLLLDMIQEEMMMSMKICSKMTLMMMMISSILSTSFLNRMMIQMSSSMKKKIQNKDDTNVELDQVRDYIF
jgi:hypothetical protein